MADTDGAGADACRDSLVTRRIALSSSMDVVNRQTTWIRADRSDEEPSYAACHGVIRPNNGCPACEGGRFLHSAGTFYERTPRAVGACKYR